MNPEKLPPAHEDPRFAGYGLPEYGETSADELDLVAAPFAEGPQTAESGPSLHETWQHVEEVARTRAHEALDESAFRKSPEVQRAFEGFYTDHLKLAATVEHVVRHPGYRLDAEDAPQFGTFATNEAAARLLSLNADPSQREQALRLAEEVTTRMLFNEACIGATTLSEAELDIIPQLAGQIKQAAVAGGVAFVGSSGDTFWRSGRNEPLASEHRAAGAQDMRRQLAAELWADSRHAGQLLFHNTGNVLDIINDSYKLRSRTGQLAEHGSFNAETAVYQGGKSHTNVPHFTEAYDWEGYKGYGKLGPRNPATIAVPIAEVIKQAPYARNSVYGVVEVKDVAVLDKATTNDAVREIGPGHFDAKGADGTDRVFFADYRADHVDAAHNYAIDFGAAASSRYGNSARILLTEGERRGEHAGRGFGLGEKIPPVEVLPFNYRHFEDGDWRRARTTLEAESQRLAPAVRDLQARSRALPQFAGKLVVPLREGVIEFLNEGQRPGEPMAQFQKDVEHSMVRAADQRRQQTT